MQRRDDFDLQNVQRINILDLRGVVPSASSVPACGFAFCFGWGGDCELRNATMSD